MVLDRTSFDGNAQKTELDAEGSIITENSAILKIDLQLQHHGLVGAWQIAKSYSYPIVTFILGRIAIKKIQKKSPNYDEQPSKCYNARAELRS